MGFLYRRKKNIFKVHSSFHYYSIHNAAYFWMIADLGAGVAALCSQLVDLWLCDVSPLLSLLQLMLQLAYLAQICIGLLLLEKIMDIKSGKWPSGTLYTFSEVRMSCFTYRLLCCPLVGLNFQLQLVHQVLQTAQVLFVLLRLLNKFVLLIKSWLTFGFMFRSVVESTCSSYLVC